MFEIIRILMSFFAALQMSSLQMSAAPHEPVVIILD
jgi:hypothetical protein